MGKDINNDNSFMIRLRSSIILMIVAITAMVFGGYVLFGLIVLISVIGLMELMRTAGFHRSGLGAVLYIFALLYYFYILLTDLLEIRTSVVDAVRPVFFPLFTALLLIVILAIYVLTFPKYDSSQICTAFFGIFYVIVTLSYIFKVRNMDCGEYTVWLIFIGSWGSDTMAYVVGRKLGKHKIAPKLSPKKSLEGLIGGILGAALIGVVYALIFKDKLSESFSMPILVFGLTGAIGSIVSQIGDMAASAIKRNKGIKDYGTLIPGHGGILDRFDSVIFIAPIVYYMLYFTINWNK